MPIYEYQCKACGHFLEVMQKMSDAPLINCPNCSQPDLAKLVSKAAFHLKGQGWYVTDFRDKKKEVSPEGTAKEDKTTPASDTKASTEKPTVEVKEKGTSSSSSNKDNKKETKE